VGEVTEPRSAMKRATGSASERRRTEEDGSAETRRTGARDGGAAALQRAVGNQTVQRLGERGALTPSDDGAEREAERRADRVVRASRSRDGESDGTDSAGSGSGQSVAGPGAVHTGLPGLGSGRPLPDADREFFEPRFGREFDDVRIHTGSAATEAAEAVNARAFTYGNHVVFNEGEYDTETPGGKRLLAHELAHVAQSTSGRTRIQRQGQGSVVDLPETTVEADLVPIRKDGQVQYVEPERAAATAEKWAGRIEEEMQAVHSTMDAHARYLENKSESFGMALSLSLAEIFAGNFEGSPPARMWGPPMNHLMTALKAIKVQEPMDLDEAEREYRKAAEAYEAAKERFWEFETSTMQTGSSRVVSTLAFTRDASFVIVSTYVTVQTGGAAGTTTVGGVTAKGTTWGALSMAGLKTTGEAAQESTEYAVGLDDELPSLTSLGKTFVLEFALGYVGGKLNEKVVDALVATPQKELAEEFGEQLAKKLVGNKQFAAEVVADFVETSVFADTINTVVDHVYNSYANQSMKGRTLLEKIAENFLSAKPFRHFLLKQVGHGTNRRLPEPDG
jgi:hypothetical protein